MSVTQPLAHVRLQVDVERWPLKAPLRITGYTFTNLDMVVVTVSEAGQVGRGEAEGVYYHGESAPKMAAQIEALRAEAHEFIA